MLASPLVIVTGASGFIGRKTIQVMVRRDWQVIAVVRRDRAVPGVRTVELDLSQSGTGLVEAIGTTPDAVLHLAATVPGADEAPDTEETAEQTRRIDRNVCDAMRHWDAYAIYTGGCSFYAGTGTEPKTETAPIQAYSPYLKAKIDGERLFLGLNRSASARVSSPFGPGQPLHAVAGRFVSRAAAGQPLEVWGSGSREQDFLHVDDIAEFFVQAIEQGATGAINVAAGQATTMLELAALVSEAVGGVEIIAGKHIDPQDGETARFDISKATRTLRWSPTVALRDGIERLMHDGA